MGAEVFCKLDFSIHQRHSVITIGDERRCQIEFRSGGESEDKNCIVSNFQMNFDIESLIILIRRASSRERVASADG